MFVSPSNQKGYINEMTLLQKLDHPNIIKYYLSYTKNSKIYIILEYAKDGDLRKMISQHQEKNFKFTQSEIFNYFTQITQSIMYIHSKKIIHRDIKPENIFLSDSYVKLGDFGVSKELSQSIDFTSTGVGTPYYISPEICEGKKYNQKCDVWSLGVVIFEMMALKRPFNFNSVSSLLYNIINCEPIEKIDQSFYSPDLIDLVYDMIKKDPNERPDIFEVEKRLVNIKKKYFEVVNIKSTKTTKTISPKNSIKEIFLPVTKHQSSNGIIFHSKMFSDVHLNNNISSSNKTPQINLSPKKITSKKSHSIQKNGNSNISLNIKSESVPLLNKKQESFNERRKRLYSRDIVSRREAKTLDKNNRRELVKRFLIEKYGEDKYAQIEQCVQETNEDIKNDLIKKIIPFDEYKKNEKYFNYLNTQKNNSHN